jgi:hypothetical protein
MDDISKGTPGAHPTLSSENLSKITCQAPNYPPPPINLSISATYPRKILGITVMVNLLSFNLGRKFKEAAKAKAPTRQPKQPSAFNQASP